MDQQLTVIGMMSGTSLDGLDLCCVTFNRTDDQYRYEIKAAETFNYSEKWQKYLKEAYGKGQDELQDLHAEYGMYIGKVILLFMQKYGLEGEVDLIGSHGQTVYHEPDKGITFQLGDGGQIAKILDIPVVSDFRSADVKLGGQGAPLVPIGDRLLFGHYDSCLNLGGIANISFEKDQERIAFDICPANLPLNKLVSEKFNITFDKNGEIASSGKLIVALKKELDQLDFYQKQPPKSLGYEWLDAHFYPVIEKYDHHPTASVLHTIVQHEVGQIAKGLEDSGSRNCMVTGGGALNIFFMDELKKVTKTEIIKPSLDLIEFKEALIFAFLAYLNKLGKINILRSVTGAKKDSVGGMLHLPPRK